MARGFRRIAKLLPKTMPEEIGAFAMKYGGAKRLKYLLASERVHSEGLTRSDATITMFIKCEKMPPNKVNPDPRAIQFRGAKYAAALAMYLKPIEEHLYRLKLYGRYNPGYRVIGKGLNQVERACLVKRKLEWFKSPVVMSLDMSRFDQHVDISQLKLEHSVYLSCCSDPFFRRILKWQLINKCRTNSGIKYTTYGKRMSGDMNTALGNCLIVVSMAVSFMDEMHLPYDLLVDGDDCLLFIEQSDFEAVNRVIVPKFLSYGHEVKIENIANSLHAINWCQSKIIETERGIKFVRDPFKVMSCALVGTRWLGKPGWVRREFLAGLADCELVLNTGVPVLSAYAMALKRNAHGARSRFDDASGEWFRYLRESRLYRHHPIDMPISSNARISFAQAYGISVDDQFAIEDRLSRWHFDLDKTTFESSWDPRTWTLTRPLVECQ
jgi:hypothetical protein